MLLAPGLAPADRLVGFPFFNPVAVLPLVEPSAVARLIALALVNAIALARAVVAVAEAVLMPETPGLRVLPVRDVEFGEEMWPIKEGRAYEGALTYLHKVKQGQDIYFFANSSEKNVDTEVVLRGKKSLRIWNPHTGEQARVRATHKNQGRIATTTVRLVLPAFSSLFYVQESA